MPRFSIINPESYRGMQIVTVPDQEVMLSQRMKSFVELWKKYDPPMGAQYDVSALEFDPAKIIAENGVTVELNVRTRINQAARAVTLAFAVGSDLDAIASRYPGGVPRVSTEIYANTDSILDKMVKDARYRDRIWLAQFAMTNCGTRESYEFFAMTGLPEAAQAVATVLRTPAEITSVVTVMMDRPDPRPTTAEILKARKFIETEDRMPMTDVLSVQGPGVIDFRYNISAWLYPWAEQDKETILAESTAQLKAKLDELRWMGQDHTRLDIDAAIKRPGIHSISISGFTGDVMAAGPTQIINVVGDPKIAFKGVRQ